MLNQVVDVVALLFTANLKYYYFYNDNSIE